jgi:hypothetical protein
MHRRLTMIMAVASVSAVSAGWLAATAGADTAKMGSALTLPMDLPGAVCTNCTTLQQSQVGGNLPLPLTSPANGVVTSWAVRTGDPGALYTLRILRPQGSNSYLGAGTSPALAAVPGGTTDSTITYPAASLPIQLGDSIGIKTAGAATGLPQAVTSGVNANVIANNFTALPPDGSSAPFTPDVQHELLLQATIKFCNVPNAVGQTQAAATAAIAAADCTSMATTQKLALKAIKKTFSKKKKKRIKASNKTLKAQNGLVLSQSPTPGTTAAPAGPPVALSVGEVVKPPKKKKKKH